MSSVATYGPRVIEYGPISKCGPRYRPPSPLEIDRPAVLSSAARPSCFVKVVVVELGNSEGLVAHADPVVHHQLRKLLAIDKYNGAASPGGGQLRLFAEGA